MKIREFNSHVKIINDGPDAFSDTAQALRHLADAIDRGEHGEASICVAVIKHSRNSAPEVFGFGGDVQYDPMLALWEGIECVASITNPPLYITVEPEFEMEG